MTENHEPGTTYVVLRRIGEREWAQVTAPRARSAHAAVMFAAREVLEVSDLEEGVELRAISVRAWEAGSEKLKARHETRIVSDGATER